MVRHWALASAGMMGRTPDYVNVSLMAMAVAEGYFAQGSAEFGRNIRNYFEHIRENDLVLTHSLDNFQRNRSPLPEHRALFEERMLHVRKETDAGTDRARDAGGWQRWAPSRMRWPCTPWPPSNRRSTLNGTLWLSAYPTILRD